jgi:hypothetical protein
MQETAQAQVPRHALLGQMRWWLWPALLAVAVAIGVGAVAVEVTTADRSREHRVVHPSGSEEKLHEPLPGWSTGQP